MFNKESNLRKAVNDTPSIVNDFRLRAPFWSYRNVDYRIPEWFLNLKPIIDAHLSELALKGALDEGNDDVLDPIIEDWTREVENDLLRQRENHKDLNMDFYIRKESDYTALNDHLARCEEKLARSRKKTKILLDRLEMYELGKELKNE